MSSISDVMIQQYEGKLEKLGEAGKNKIKYQEDKGSCR